METETALPSPMTPLDCDLRGFEWMPLDPRRILRSDTWLLGSAEEKMAMMSLLMESWHQVPAGSLPDNDKLLAYLSGTGPDWPSVRVHALRGWIKCSDGRLYHPVICEKARAAHKSRLEQIARTEAARKAKAERKAEGVNLAIAKTSVTEPVTESVTDPVTASATESVTDVVTESVTGSRLERDKIREEYSKEVSLGETSQICETAPSTASAAPPPAPEIVPKPARGSRLRADWTPDASSREFATAQGLQPDATAAQFRDYWIAQPGARGIKLDWPATWRNWCRNEARRRPGRSGQASSKLDWMRGNFAFLPEGGVN